MKALIILILLVSCERAVEQPVKEADTLNPVYTALSSPRVDSLPAQPQVD